MLNIHTKTLDCIVIDRYSSERDCNTFIGSSVSVHYIFHQLDVLYKMFCVSSSGENWNSDKNTLINRFFSRIIWKLRFCSINGLYEFLIWILMFHNMDYSIGGFVYYRWFSTKLRRQADNKSREWHWTCCPIILSLCHARMTLAGIQNLGYARNLQ